jgi:peptide/nickel transport system permease protein
MRSDSSAPAGAAVVHPVVQLRGQWPARLVSTRRYLQRNPSLPVGALMLLALLAFSAIGRATIDHGLAEPLAALPNQPPSQANLFGTDAQGRDLFAVIILGTWLTFKVGVVAGGIGVALGAAVGFVAAYYRGWVDAVLRVVVDVGLTIPPLLFLVVIASSRQGATTSTLMALMIAALAWLGPARQIRAQALVLRDANYVAMARLSGASSMEIIFSEMLPNLLPFLMAGFVLAVSQAILAAVGLEALGLGPTDEPTLGMTVYWMMVNTAFIRSLWWWIVAPIAVLVVLFVSLFLISEGLDEFSNPRLRRRVAA